MIEGFREWEEHLEVYGWGMTEKVYNKFGQAGRHIVLWVAEIAIGKKKLTDRSKGWWSREIEAAIQAHIVSRKKLRETRSGDISDKSLLWQWEKYKSARRQVD